MRRVLLALTVGIVGCKGSIAPPPSHASASPPDPLVARRDADAQAAYGLDAALDAIGKAQAATRKLAPVAGGEAKEALLNVAEMFDSSGATLAEHSEPPPPIEAYRQAAGERTSEREKAVADALDALHELRDAQGTLDDLSANAPPEHKARLETIQVGTDEAIESVEDAIRDLGGKVPPEEGE